MFLVQSPLDIPDPHLDAKAGLEGSARRTPLETHQREISILKVGSSEQKLSSWVVTTSKPGLVFLLQIDVNLVQREKEDDEEDKGYAFYLLEFIGGS